MAIITPLPARYLNWLALNYKMQIRQQNRARDYSLEPLRSFNADEDPRHVRRDLSDDELLKLICTTERRDLERGMKGVDRAALYLIAATTGYRRKELRSLTLQNFDLDAETPTISVSARATKAGRSDCQPIPKVVAEYLKDWIGSKTQNGPLFSKMPVNTARTLRWDLKAAGIPYCDDSGRVFDFHALRGAYISRIERTGATPKTLQTLARHSDPRLTMKRYARIRLNDQVAAVEQLSTLVPNQTPCRVPLEATGTCDHSAQQYRQQRGRKTVQNSAIRCDDRGPGPLPDQPPKRLVLSGKSDEMRRGATRNEKRPRRDLNPCFQDENLMS